MAGEKTEKATPKRKQDERKKGNIFQSREVVVVFSLLATFYGFKLLGPLILSTLQNCMTNFFSRAGSLNELGTSEVASFFMEACGVFTIAAMPMLLIGSGVTILLTVAQTRGLFAMKAAAPKFNRLNPLQGIKKMFSLRGVDMDFAQIMAMTGNMVLSIAQTAALVMFFVAAADYFYQWWDYEKNLRMTKQEIKEEYKQTEGDPQIKGKIRERQQAQARQRMMQQVPSADVVIRNPTHFAVAIRYEPERNNAPVVVAKGVDSLALRIVAVAEENGVFVTENRPLARGLYETVDLDHEIPDKFYQPVAEVLAFVYSLKKKDLN